MVQYPTVAQFFLCLGTVHRRPAMAKSFGGQVAPPAAAMLQALQAGQGRDEEIGKEMSLFGTVAQW